MKIENFATKYFMVIKSSHWKVLELVFVFLVFLSSQKYETKSFFTFFSFFAFSIFPSEVEIWFSNCKEKGRIESHIIRNISRRKITSRRY